MGFILEIHFAQLQPSLRIDLFSKQQDISKHVRIVIPIGKSRFFPVKYLDESVGEGKVVRIIK
jgi:hypothetical protein